MDDNDIVLSVKASTLPKYLQIAGALECWIRERNLQPGDKLPSGRRLSRDLSMNPVTVNKGMDELAKRGILERKVGSGTYLTTAKPGSIVPDGQASGTDARRRICFVTPDISHSFYGAMVAGGIHQAGENGYDLNILNTGYDSKREAALLCQLASLPPHIVLVCTNGGAKCRDALARLADRSFHVVMVDRHFEGLPCDIIENDNIAIGMDSVNYLRRLGHRRIAHATLGVPSDLNAALRLEGYRRAMTAAGLSPEPFEILAEGESWNRDCERRCSLWLKRLDGDLPSAIFAVNDTVCVGIMRAVRKAGLAIPGDISLLGCADLDIAQALLDPLSTIDQDSYGMGARAVAIGIAHLEERSTGEVREIHPHRLIERCTVRHIEGTRRKNHHERQ